MKKFYNKYMKWGLTALIVLVLAICFVFLVFKGQNIGDGLDVFFAIIMPVIDGLIIAFIATPVLNWIEEKITFPIYKKLHIDVKKQKIKKQIRGISLLLTFFFIGSILYGFFSIVIPQLIRSIQSIIVQFPVYINNLTTLIEELLADNPEVEKYLEDLLDTYSADLDEWLEKNFLPKMNSFIGSISMSVTMSVISILRSLYNLIVGLIISVYVLAGKEKFASQGKKICYAMLERSTANQTIQAFRFINKTFIGFLSGKIVDSAIIGVLCFVGTSILQTPYAILISVIVGVTNVIPVFGPYIGAIPSALLVLMINPVKCIPFIIFVLALQQLDGNVIGPKILGNSTGLTSFWVIFSIILFGGLWGVGGMVIGVPLFAVFYAGVRYIVNRHLSRKQLSTDTADYDGLDYINEQKEYVSFHDEENGLLNNSQIEEGKKEEQP